MESRTNPLGWPRWAWHCLLGLALVMAAFSVAGSLSNVARSAGLLRDLGGHGLTLGQTAETPVGWSEVFAVAPGGPAANAGLVPGDLIRFDGLFGYSIGYGSPPTRPAEPAEVTIERAGIRFHRAIAYPPGPPFPGTEPLIALNALTALVMTSFGAVLLIRGRRNRAAVMLGLILLYIALAAARLPAWSPMMAVAQARALATILSVAAMGWFWPHFALEISGGAATQRQARVVGAGALLFVALGVAAAIVSRLPVAPPIAGAAQAGWLTFVGGGWLFGFAIIAGNYRRNDPPARNRVKIVVVAFVCYLLAQALNQSVSILLEVGYPPIQGFWFGIGAASLSFAGLGMLVYAVLGQRLFDLNFALNRTLVYAAVSFVVLTAFGLAKWVIEHLIPESWHAGSEYYSVGIALGLFLVLHRVHDWVEHNVERFVFSPWHRNEEALRRFVSAAGHFDQTPVLCRAFAGELERFSGGAGAAVYLRDRGGAYGLQCGTLGAAPPHLDGDDLAFALMRAERGPVRLADTRSALPGVLALPMLDHGKLAGLALLDRKSAGTDYRPDEVELLGWATHQVGLDLQAMHAGELEAEVAGLSAQVAALSAQLAAARTSRRTRGAGTAA